MFLKTVKVTSNKEKLRNYYTSKEIKRHDDRMRYGVLDWMLEQRKHISGKTGEI